MINRLDWDSECFGYEVGRMEIDNLEDFRPDELPTITKGFKLVYIFSKDEVAARCDNFILADRKVLLKRETHMLADEYSGIRSYHENVTEQLLRLAFQSGEFSRFKTDKAFINNEFQKLYSEWIKNSVDRTIADDLFFFGEVNDVQGFITLGKKGTIADIGLVAVDSAYRGRGIGSLLVRYAVDWAYRMGYHEIQVVTQYENRLAMAIYEKNGFSLSSLTYIYHYRNE